MTRYSLCFSACALLAAFLQPACAPESTSDDDGAARAGSSIPQDKATERFPLPFRFTRCGNHRIEPGETCDPPSQCPHQCDDGNACTVDLLTGDAHHCNAACRHRPIRVCVAGDGCCPAGCGPSTDSDCPSSCGNGVLEPGETCDPPSSCATSCDDANACTTDQMTGSADTCNVACSHSSVTDCVSGDACCPPGCSDNFDSDCSPSCGNGVLDSGESCDPPTSCPTSCNDGEVCTIDTLTGSAEACSSSCSHQPIVSCVSADGCCPAGCNNETDEDCSPDCNSCAPDEYCEYLPAYCGPIYGDVVGCTKKPESCAASGSENDCGCDGRIYCSMCVLHQWGVSLAQAGHCSSYHGPRIGWSPCHDKSCTDGDGCCPSACNSHTDSDCTPTCGNGVIETGETCDPPSSCPTSCDDQDTCSTDTATGSAETCDLVCTHTAEFGCASGDGCCPRSCSIHADSDCGGEMLAVAITAGDEHSCALLADGTSYCWGANDNGQLGTGSLMDSSEPQPVTGLSGATSISAGGHNTCAIMQDGALRCWGANASQQLGDGTTTDQPTPVTNTLVSNVVGIAVNSHTCAIVSGGSVRCWGANSQGQLGDGTRVDSAIPITVGVSNATLIDSSSSDVCTLLSDGTVWGWGDGGMGQLGTSGQTLFFANPPLQILGVTGAVQIATGVNHTCALLSDHTVQCWGARFDVDAHGMGIYPMSGLPLNVAGVTDAIALSAGSGHTCAVLRDGTLRCWGTNVPDNKTHGALPTAVASITNAVAVAGGGLHACALLSGGCVQCWGDNSRGQLGNGTTTSSSVPVRVKGFNCAF